MRPQDKWNQKNGYISKSYKLNKLTVNDFEKACKLENVSKAKILTQFMENFSQNIGRRKTTMYVKMKYYEKQPYDEFLQKSIDEGLRDISLKKIDSEKSRILKELEKRPLFYKFQDNIESTKRFECYEDLDNYMSKQNAIVQYVLGVCIKEMAIFELMREGVLMPVIIREDSVTEVDVIYSRGNILLEIYFDMLPFEVFALVKKIQ